jgi:predicted acylesterase/phospholipase RssA
MARKPKPIEPPEVKGPVTPAAGKKKAICLAGGGPAAGLHIGVLEGLKERKIVFDDANSIWALSCIGAWVGVIYNQAKTDKLEAAKEFFRGVFREDKSFDGFPINTIFSTDWFGNAEALHDFLLEPRNYRNTFLPREIMKSVFYTMSAIRRMGAPRWRQRGGEWYQEFQEFNEGDFNRWTLNHVLAVNPLVRFLTAMIYKSEITGLAKLHYPESRFLKDIQFANLYADGAPWILYNAWNLKKKELQLFTNRKPPKSTYHYKDITPASLCACSALPYIEQTVKIDEDTYCEGALRDTVNFRQLIEDHNSKDEPLEEIWINRIVDAHQVRKPDNIHDALANLCEMFAATVGEDDVRLFKHHVRAAATNPEMKDKAFQGIIVEVKVDSKINFKWNHKNLNDGIGRGKAMAEAAWKLYDKFKGEKKPGKLLMIPDDIPIEEVKAALTGHPEDHVDAVLAGHPHIRHDHKEEAKLTARLGTY